MIRIDDLREAIAECEGVRNPNANTCLTLASLYTILDHKEQKQTEQQTQMYSYAASPSDTIQYRGESEFADAIYGKNADEVFSVLDELMATLEGMMPRLYDGVIVKLNKI